MLKIIRKEIPQTCWICIGEGCKTCDNTGLWKESINYIITKDRKGKLICFDSDNIG